MTLWLNEQHMESIRRHGVREYPDECCGVLLGHADGGRKEVVEVVPLKNLRHDREQAQRLLPLEAPETESERNRFLIDPRDQLKVQKDARARGLEILGYYHSHPDHPASPSNYDRDHAWPWYCYVIVSVERGQAKDLSAWVLAEDRSGFNPEPMEELKP